MLSPFWVGWLRRALPRQTAHHAFLGKGATDDKIDGWYLDIGSTHHMTGRREFFSDLYCGVKASV
jgi:hypothetical protein